MEEAISIVCGNNQHWFNPETGDFELSMCACPHSLLEQAEKVKKEKRYKGHIELCQINLKFDETIFEYEF